MSTQLQTMPYISLLCDQKYCFFAYRSCSQSLQPHSYLSSTHNLVQGLFERFGDQSLFKLRNRIFTNEPASASIQGLVDVAAKRITIGNFDRLPFLMSDSLNKRWGSTQDSPDSQKIYVNVGWYPNQERLEPFWLHETPEIVSWAHRNQIENSKIKSDQEATRILGGLISQISKANASPSTSLIQVPNKDPIANKLHDQARPIAAILVGQDGSLLSWSVNSARWNKTAHAEIKMIQKWHLKTRAAIPKGATIYTSQQCCRMCAGYIWDMSEDVQTVKVRYLQRDCGSMAQNTVLQTGCSARRLFAKSPAELCATIEEHLSDIDQSPRFPQHQPL